MKRIRVSIYLLIILSMLLAACAGGVTPQAEQSGETQAPPPSGETVTVNMWIFEGEGGFLPTLIESFEAANPNIKIQLTDIPEGDYVTKLDTALLANDPPDLAYVYEGRYLKAGSFLPLGDFFMTQDINLEDYNEGAMSSCFYEGEVYCAGTYVGAVLMFYNKDLFDAAGVPYPSATDPMTIDEYALMLQPLTVQSEDINERVWGGDAGAPVWWVERKTMFSDDGRQTDGYINDEATAHFYDVLAGLRSDGSVMTSAEGQLMEGTDLLATGKLATSIIDNAVAIPTLEEAGIRWGAAPPPVEKEGDPPFIPTWSDGFGVMKGSDHPEEAMLFLAHYIKEGNKLQLELGNLPLDLKLAEESGYAEGNEGRQETLNAIQVGATEILFVPGFWDVIDPTWDGFEEIAEGREAQDLLNEIAPIMQETLEQSWETWESIE